MPINSALILSDSKSQSNLINLTLPSIADSSVIDDEVGSQEFLEKLLVSRGLDPQILISEDINDGDSDIEQQEYFMESQKVFTSSSAPPSPSKDLSQDQKCMASESFLSTLFF